MNNTINKQLTKEFTEETKKKKIVVDYGFNYFKGQEPYFSVTATIFRFSRTGWYAERCGCLNDYVRKHFPEIAYLIKWHLSTFVKGPLHYVENAVFWWKRSCLDTADNKYDTCFFWIKSA